MKILIVSSYLPYPLFSGGAVRLFNIIKELAKKNKITLVCEIRSSQTTEDISEVKKYCEDIFVFPRKKQWSLENILNTGFSDKPFLVIGHTIGEMKKCIFFLLTNKHFDIIHAETSYILQNIPKTYIPIIAVEHNIEYLVYERYMNLSSWYLRPFLFIDIQKLKKWEENSWNKVSKLISVSEKERSLMPRKDVEIVPNGVDIRKFRIMNYELRIKKKERRILFIGDFKWIQNKKSAEWILKEIWPAIKSKINNYEYTLKLWVVGKNIPSFIKELGDESVIFDENASDQTERIYQKSYLLLAPINVGGGTSYKIIESMASGVPVVTTNLGIEGIKARIGKEAMIGESTEEICMRVISLLEDDELYNNMAIAARNFVETNFSWELIVKKLEGIYQSVVKDGGLISKL